MVQPSTPSKTTPMAEGDRTFMTTRRGVLKGIYGALIACGLGSFFYGAYRFLAPGGGAAAPVEIPLSAVPVGGSYAFQYGTTPAILLREDEGKMQAFSLICTHMACTVTWNGEKREFYCPCHDGYFDANGNVLSGPPPAPLEHLRVALLDDKVRVGGA
jgi:cytochrome b6-f complex iron-sulfur subunit